MRHLYFLRTFQSLYPKDPGVCPKKGITPIHSYSCRMGLEPEKSYSREGSGFLGLSEMYSNKFRLEMFLLANDFYAMEHQSYGINSWYIMCL